MRTYKVPQIPDEVVDDAPSFRLVGTYAKNHPDAGSEWSEEFHCIPKPPLGVMITLANTVRSDGKGNSVYDAGQVVSFLRTVLVVEERRRFVDLVNSPDRLVELPLLVEIMQGVDEDYTDRPFGQESTSSDGPGRDAGTSTGGSDETESTPTT